MTTVHHSPIETCIDGCTAARIDKDKLDHLLHPANHRTNGQFMRSIGFPSWDLLEVFLAYHIGVASIVKERPTPYGPIYTLEGKLQTTHKGADPLVESLWQVVGGIAIFGSVGRKKE